VGRVILIRGGGAFSLLCSQASLGVDFLAVALIYVIC